MAPSWDTKQPDLHHHRRRARRLPLRRSTFTRFLVVVIIFFTCYLFVTNCNSNNNSNNNYYYIFKHTNLAPISLGLPYLAWPNVNADVPFSDLEEIALKYPSPERAKEWSRYYTSGPHLAGKNYSQAIWTKIKMEEFGFKSEIVSYDTYLNYPKSHRLALLQAKKSPDGESGVLGDRPEFEVKYEAKLEEPVIAEDSTTGLKDRIPTFHGYSASGNVTGPLVFANYGTLKDYEALVTNNITISGSVVIVKYGRIFRGLKVKRAQELGALGVLMYSDPGDDGNITLQQGYKAYPNGPARHPESVQRGSVQFLSFGPGDPTTPGYPSLPGVPRENPDKFIPVIPSLPISYVDALPLLRALNGHGPLGSSINWKDGGLGYLDVKYNIGPTPPDVVVNLVNQVEYTTTPIWNVITTIEGSDPSQGTIIVGNHRDSWIAGGAGDPNSGSAALIEMAGAFSEMAKSGWKPTRKIILASWDGEEYGLLGSTEWVEQYANSLKTDAIAYLNVDIGAVGSTFKVGANPLLDGLIGRVLADVPSPKLSTKSIKDTWDGHVDILGSGSDYTAFQDFIGIPSIDMGFTGKSDSIWMYHSNYDSFHWMEKFGDPGFEYHATIAKIWTLMALHLSSVPILPMNASEYANRLASYIDEIKNEIKNPGDKHMQRIFSLSSSSKQSTFSIQNATAKVDFSMIDNSLSNFISGTSNLQKYIFYLTTRIIEIISTQPRIPKWYDLKAWVSRVILYYQVKAVNTMLQKIDREFTYEPGLDGRKWFKHIVFAPGRWTGYEGVAFPGLVDALEDGNAAKVHLWKEIIGFAIINASGKVCDVLERTEWKCAEKQAH